MINLSDLLIKENKKQKEQFQLKHQRIQRDQKMFSLKNKYLICLFNKNINNNFHKDKLIRLK